MSLANIWYYLINDTVGLSASTVSSENSDLFPTAADVPPHAYKPLSEIWVGSASGSGEMANRVVYQHGLGFEESRGEITLRGYEIPSSEDPAEGEYSNDPGAETMRLNIVFRQPDELTATSADYQRIIQAELRVRYLLDENWRRKRRPEDGILVPATYDRSIISGIRCTRMRQLDPPNAKEFTASYIVCYTRAITRS